MAKKSRKSSDSQSSPAPAHGELRSGPIVGTAIINGATFRNKGLAYAVVDGDAMFEGDIVLGKADALRAAGTGDLPQASLGITGAQFRWPNATVPYEIDPALPNQQRVTDAIAAWHANTRIRLVPRNAAQHPDYVRFVPGGGCSSMVGRQGGRQNITLGANCTTGNCVHEIGHAVGLWHEQSREDRDTFVQIVWANIDPAMQHNFTQHVADGDDLGPYDFGSIMHYPPNAFSVNGQNTIVPRQALPPGVVMGQRSGLSAGDVAGVHALYPGAATIKELAKDPATDPVVTVKEVRKDPATDPVTVKEVRKDPVRDPTVKEIRKDPVSDPTIKEVRKDPVADPTIKEAALDPIPGPGPLLPGPIRPIGSPFVLATPSRAGYGAADQVAAASAQVEQYAAAIADVEAQHAELVAAYDAAVQALEALQGQG